MTLRTGAVRLSWAVMPAIKIPTVGESISTALVSAWHKQDGEPVAAGDVLLTLETDKVSTELTADAGGVLRIKVPAGEEVPVGTVVGEIEPDGGTAPGRLAVPSSSAPSALGSQAQADSGGGKLEPTPARSEKGTSEKPEPAPESPPARASIPEKKTADETPAATGSAFTVLSSERATAAGNSPPAKPPPGPETRITRRKLTPLRRKIAAQLVMAQHTAAMLTTFNEADMSAVIKMRKDLQESFTERHGVKLGFMSFFIKAVVDALKAVPQLNSRLDGDELVEHHFYDISVAVSTGRGLFVPVIRDCDKKSFADLERAISDVATRTRDGKIELAELQGGVFTITNGGIFGSLLSTPILNPPQSGILGMHAIQERPVVRDGQIVARPMMNLALSYDHRVVDGREAVTFLVHVKEYIENPARLLLGA